MEESDYEMLQTHAFSALINKKITFVHGPRGWAYGHRCAA